MWSCQLFHMQWRWGQWSVFACLDCCWYWLRLSQKVGVLIFTPILSNSRNKPSRLPRQPTRQECLAFQISFIFVLQSANEECHNSILSVVGLLLEFQNATALEMAAAAVCIPACQSFYDLQVSCLGQEEADNRTTFYCGRNSQGQACYEVSVQ